MNERTSRLPELLQALVSVEVIMEHQSSAMVANGPSTSFGPKGGKKRKRTKGRIQANPIVAKGKCKGKHRRGSVLVAVREDNGGLPVPSLRG